MAVQKEDLGGGLWTGTDPGLLDPGQLADIRNGVYLPATKSLQRAPGRVAFGTVSATAADVTGLRDLTFNNGDHYLIAMAGNKYRVSPVGDSGTFTDLATIALTGTQLEAAQYANRFYLMNGASASASAIGSNLVAYLSATAAGSSLKTRQHGMLPVIAAPVSATAGGVFALTVTGYYEYWTTEVAKFSQDGATTAIESTFMGSPTTVFVSATGVVPVIAMPAIQNGGLTTHWRVYRSPKKDTQAQVEFPAGFLISEVGTATAQVSDTLTTSNSGYILPPSVNVAGYADFANASALELADGSYATATAIAGINAHQGVYGFNFGAIKGSIVGIQAEVKGYATQGGACQLEIGIRDSSGFWSGSPVGAKGFTITGTTPGGASVVTLGGASDLWSYGGVPAAIRDTDLPNLMAVLTVQGPATMGFDYVKLMVYSGATIDDQTQQFPTVVYSFGDTTVQVGKNGPPPSSSTGDIFEDQLVVNDVSNPTIIRYSYPGDTEAFPSTYFLNFPTFANEPVRGIRVVNDQLVVWLDGSCWRVNYLPSERDASFDRGKAKKAISSKFGLVNPMCIARFSPDGSEDLVAFVSHHGIHGTNSYGLDTYTAGLDWSKILGPNGTPICLINDARRRLLLFYFQDTVNYGNETFLCMPLAYGESHWTQWGYNVHERPRICGFIHMRNTDTPGAAGGHLADLKSAWSAQRSNGNVSVYMGYGGAATAAGAGQVWIESGSAIPAEDPRLKFTTRDLYLAGFGMEWELGELYAYAYGYDATTPQLAYTATLRKTNQLTPRTGSTKTITLGGQKFHRAGTFREMCEAASIACAVTASAISLEHLMIDGTGWGKEDAGTS